MYSSLMPQMLGIHISLEKAIDLATRHGFEGVDTDGASLLALASDDIAQIRDSFERNSIRPGYVALPPGRIPVRDEEWGDAVESWPQIARIAQSLGYTRAALVLLPFHESLDQDAALDEHVRRLKSVVPILVEHGLRLGLEYVSAPSRRAPYATHTVWNLAGMVDLLARIDSPQIGVMLDTFHWHGAGETAADLKALRSEQIVVVHANDAPDCSLAEQVVTERSLPGTTGVIDSPMFFATLRELGYDGPVTCEPMQPAIDRLNSGSEEVLCKTISRALKQVMA